MNIKQLLESYYQELKKDDNKFYNIKGVRNEISSKAENLISILDKKDQEGIDIDTKILSFLSFIRSYDMPRYEDDEFMFDKTDLDREYRELGNMNALDGIKVEI